MDEGFLKSESTLTSNNLLDVINWLKLGAYVIVHTNSARFFHKCTNKDLSEDEISKYINQHKIVYVDVSKLPGLPGLLDNGEWNWYINEAGFDECKCSIKRKLSNPKMDLPYCERLKLGI